MITVDAYAAPSANAPLTKTTIDRRDLTQSDVLIDIKFAGICHSDIHTGRDEWGHANYPLTPGHEIAGIVTEVGSGVTKYKVGDRVGVGVMVDSCRECVNCKAGEEQFCVSGMTGTYNSIDKYGETTAGGYSKQIVVDENYVLSVPEGIELDKAAPLLCAGITLYSPLNYWNAGPGKKVGIIGLGGLGHMGVQIAHAMGAEVTVFSQSLKKREDGLRLGADHYYATSNPDTFESLGGTYDLIINTVSAPIDANAFLGLLTTNGTLVQVGGPSEPIEVDAFALIRGRKSMSGSLIGGIRETQKMLNFCGQHNLGAEVETISADQINEAWDRVVNSDVRYRFVIDTATI